VGERSELAAIGNITISHIIGFQALPNTATNSITYDSTHSTPTLSRSMRSTGKVPTICSVDSAKSDISITVGWMVNIAKALSSQWGIK
jgi:hypothetical protein